MRAQNTAEFSPEFRAYRRSQRSAVPLPAHLTPSYTAYPVPLSPDWRAGQCKRLAPDRKGGLAASRREAHAACAHASSDAVAVAGNGGLRGPQVQREESWVQTDAWVRSMLAQKRHPPPQLLHAPIPKPPGCDMSRKQRMWPSPRRRRRPTGGAKLSTTCSSAGGVVVVSVTPAGDDKLVAHTSDGGGGGGSASSDEEEEEWRPSSFSPSAGDDDGNEEDRDGGDNVGSAASCGDDDRGDNADSECSKLSSAASNDGHQATTLAAVPGGATLVPGRCALCGHTFQCDPLVQLATRGRIDDIIHLWKRKSASRALNCRDGLLVDVTREDADVRSRGVGRFESVIVCVFCTQLVGIGAAGCSGGTTTGGGGQHTEHNNAAARSTSMVAAAANQASGSNRPEKNLVSVN